MWTKIWRKLFPPAPSLIKSGSREERHALASMIEKGLETGIGEDLTFIPDHSEDCPPVLSIDPDQQKLCASTTGYALLGLGREPMELCADYQRMVEQERVRAYYSGLPPGGIPAIAAAVDFLKLPFALILEAEHLRHFGFSIVGVIEELRK